MAPLAFCRKRIDLLLALALFAGAICVYGFTLCPTLYWGDCGELAAAAYNLGITHPTGYPLWCLLGKAWTLLFPFGTIIWRLNVLSALFGALAIVLLFCAARAWGLPRLVSTAAAGLLAFSGTFWQQCLFAETYSLTVCFTAALLFLALRWRARGCRFTDLSLLAVCYGFALTNGQLNTLFLPGFIAFVLWSDPRLRVWRSPDTRRVWGRLLALTLLPLLLYVYLPLRAAAHPAVNWGDPETLFAFYYHVTGRAYAAEMFHMPLTQVWRNFLEWAGALNGQFAWPLVALAMFGLVSLWRRDRPTGLLLTWVLLADIVFAVNYYIYNRYIYFLPSYVVLALLIGVGTNTLGKHLAQHVSAQKRLGMIRLSRVCLLVLVPFQLLAHWSENNLHRNWACRDYGHNILASVPQGGVLVQSGQDTSHSATLYLQNVEHERPDVLVVQCQMLGGVYDIQMQRWANLWYWNNLKRRAPFLRTLYGPHELTPALAWNDDIMHRLLARAVATGRPVAVLGATQTPPIFDDRGHPVLLADYLTQHYDVAQVGLVGRVYARGTCPDADALLAQTETVWRDYSLRGLSGDLYLQDDFLSKLTLDYAGSALVRGRLAYARGDYNAAEDAYRFVLRLFRSDEATAGLDRCAEARTRRKKLAFAPPH